MNTIKLFDFEHPKYGYYSVWFDTEMKTYGITKSDAPPWCAYATITELFKLKGL